MPCTRPLAFTPALVLVLAAALALAPLPARAEESASGPVTVKVKGNAKAESKAEGQDKAPAEEKKSKKSKKKSHKAKTESKSGTKAKAGSATGEGDKNSAAPKKTSKTKKGKSRTSKGHAAESAESAAPAPCYNLRSGGKTKSGKHGRCEPQSLTYARCRKGITSCRIGHENGPLTWYRCETGQGNTSATPQDGAILILGKNRHGMPTGHVMVVEKAEQKGTGTWRLVLSHTNYDRRCHLERDIEATYHQAAKTLDIHTGAWKAWGKGLPVAGFILD